MSVARNVWYIGDAANAESISELKEKCTKLKEKINALCEQV